MWGGGDHINNLKITDYNSEVISKKYKNNKSLRELFENFTIAVICLFIKFQKLMSKVKMFSPIQWTTS